MTVTRVKLASVRVHDLTVEVWGGWYISADLKIVNNAGNVVFGREHFFSADEHLTPDDDPWGPDEWTDYLAAHGETLVDAIIDPGLWEGM